MLSKMYKLTFDLSICFIIGGFILNFYLGQRIFLGDFLILLVTGLILVPMKDKRKLKGIILIVIPLSYLLITALPMQELIIFLVILVYFAYVIIANRFEAGRGDFVDMIKRLFMLSLVLIFPMLVNFSKFRATMVIITPYLVVAIISAIFLLRNLRVGNEMDQMKTYEKQQFIELTLFLVICLLLTLIKAPLHMLEGAKLLYQYIVIPILVLIVSILGGIFYVLIYLVSLLIGLIPGNKSERMQIDVAEVIGETTKNLVINQKETFSLLPIVYFVGAVLAVIILFFFFRWLRGNIYVRSIPSGITEIRETLDNTKPRKNNIKIKSSKNSREAIRYYYGKYMVWLQTKKVELYMQDTTKDIENKYKRLVKGDNEEEIKLSQNFSDLYKDARYQLTREITEEEAVRAKELYQTIKSSKINKK